MRKFGERNGQCNMNYKTKDQIKEEAFDILHELEMEDIRNTYDVLDIEESIYNKYIITVSPDNFKDVINVFIKMGLTSFATSKMSNYIEILISEYDLLNKLTNKKIKRLHDCIEDLYK